MLMEANFTRGWANDLLTILKNQFGLVDKLVTQFLVQEFHNMEMLPLQIESNLI